MNRKDKIQMLKDMLKGCHSTVNTGRKALDLDFCRKTGNRIFLIDGKEVTADVFSEEYKLQIRLFGPIEWTEEYV